MAAITYTAASRAPLITDSPAHTASTEYSFDVKLQQFSTAIEMPKTQHVSLGGTVETVLGSTRKIHQIVLIFPDTLQAQMREFLYSVAAGEQFSFDPYGSVASADDPINVVMTNPAVQEIRIQHGTTPWRTVSLSIREIE